MDNNVVKVLEKIDKLEKLSALGGCIFGGVFIAIGIFCILRTINRKKRCINKTTGNVIDISKERSTDSEGFTIVHCYPIIEYYVDEKKVVKKAIESSSKYYIGQEVEVFYNPDDYSDSYIEGNRNYFLTPGIISLTVGLIIMFISIIR